MISICYFGSFISGYARNKILIKGLRQNGAYILMCEDHSKGVVHYFKLLRQFFKTCRNCDVILIGAACIYDVPFAWVLGKLFSKKIVYDAFISLYDTYVFDRELINKNSISAFKIYMWEYLACHLADIVYLDTQSDADYFIKTFKIKKDKVKVIFVGADDELFIPSQKNNKSNLKHVGFYGSFQPLHGIDYIIEAASKLNNNKIRIQILGEGQTKQQITNRVRELKLKNVEFVGWKTLEEIKTFIENKDIMLGIFGKTDKASRVIPIKIYEAMAMEKAVITMRSKAICELFTDGENIIMVDHNNPQELASAIEMLILDSELKEKIENNGYQLFKNKLTPRLLGKQLLELIN